MRNTIQRLLARLVNEPDLNKKYNFDDLEAAACLWATVLFLERSDPTTVRIKTGCKVDHNLSVMIEDAHCVHSEVGLRRIVLGWVEQLSQDWRKVDTKEGQFPEGGQADKPFDWYFVTDWILRNVDWTDPHQPKLK